MGSIPAQCSPKPSFIMVFFFNADDTTSTSQYTVSIWILVLIFSLLFCLLHVDLLDPAEEIIHTMLDLGYELAARGHQPTFWGDHSYVLTLLTWPIPFIPTRGKWSDSGLLIFSNPGKAHTRNAWHTKVVFDKAFDDDKLVMKGVLGICLEMDYVDECSSKLDINPNHRTMIRLPVLHLFNCHLQSTHTEPMLKHLQEAARYSQLKSVEVAMFDQITRQFIEWQWTERLPWMLCGDFNVDSIADVGHIAGWGTFQMPPIVAKGHGGGSRTKKQINWHGFPKSWEYTKVLLPSLCEGERVVDLLLRDQGGHVSTRPRETNPTLRQKLVYKYPQRLDYIFFRPGGVGTPVSVEGSTRLAHFERDFGGITKSRPCSDHYGIRTMISVPDLILWNAFEPTPGARKHEKPPQSVWVAFRTAVNKFRSRPCIGWRRTDAGATDASFHSLTYGQVYTQASFFGSGLISFAVEKSIDLFRGRNIAILLENSPECIICMLACTRFSLVSLPLSSIDTPTLDFLALQASVVIAHREFTKLIKSRGLLVVQFEKLIVGDVADVDYESLLRLGERMPLPTTLGRDVFTLSPIHMPSSGITFVPILQKQVLASTDSLASALGLHIFPSPHTPEAQSSSAHNTCETPEAQSTSANNTCETPEAHTPSAHNTCEAGDSTEGGHRSESGRPASSHRYLCSWSIAFPEERLMVLTMILHGHYVGLSLLLGRSFVDDIVSFKPTVICNHVGLPLALPGIEKTCLKAEEDMEEIMEDAEEEDDDDVKKRDTKRSTTTTKSPSRLRSILFNMRTLYEEAVHFFRLPAVRRKLFGRVDRSLNYAGGASASTSSSAAFKQGGYQGIECLLCLCSPAGRYLRPSNTNTFRSQFGHPSKFRQLKGLFCPQSFQLLTCMEVETEEEQIKKRVGGSSSSSSSSFFPKIFLGAPTPSSSSSSSYPHDHVVDNKEKNRSDNNNNNNNASFYNRSNRYAAIGKPLIDRSKMALIPAPRGHRRFPHSPLKEGFLFWSFSSDLSSLEKSKVPASTSDKKNSKSESNNQSVSEIFTGVRESECNRSGSRSTQKYTEEPSLMGGAGASSWLLKNPLFVASSSSGGENRRRGLTCTAPSTSTSGGKEWVCKGRNGRLPACLELPPTAKRDRSCSFSTVGEMRVEHDKVVKRHEEVHELPTIIGDAGDFFAPVGVGVSSLSPSRRKWKKKDDHKEDDDDDDDEDEDMKSEAEDSENEETTTGRRNGSPVVDSSSMKKRNEEKDENEDDTDTDTESDTGASHRSHEDDGCGDIYGGHIWFALEIEEVLKAAHQWVQQVAVKPHTSPSAIQAVVVINENCPHETTITVEGLLTCFNERLRKTVGGQVRVASIVFRAPLTLNEHGCTDATGALLRHRIFSLGEEDEGCMPSAYDKRSCDQRRLSLIKTSGCSSVVQSEEEENDDDADFEVESKSSSRLLHYDSTVEEDSPTSLPYSSRPQRHPGLIDRKARTNRTRESTAYEAPHLGEERTGREERAQERDKSRWREAARGSHDSIQTTKQRSGGRTRTRAAAGRNERKEAFSFNEQREEEDNKSRVFKISNVAVAVNTGIYVQELEDGMLIMLGNQEVTFAGTSMPPSRELARITV